MVITTMRADELIPGDKFDTRCGIADLNVFSTVTKIRYIDNDGPGEGRVEIHIQSNAMSSSRTVLASSIVRIWTN